jgi:hypothetical protein
VINDGPRDSRFIRINAAATPGLIINNVFSGPGKLLEGPGGLRNNLIVDKSDFVSAADYDYRLKATSSAVNAGVDAGEARGVSLVPSFEYMRLLQSAPRKNDGRLDLGAFEQ